jgi:hypothetical protein
MKEKQYLISESELIKFIEKTLNENDPKSFCNCNEPDEIVQDFLKSKQPVKTLNREEVEKIFKTEWLSGDAFSGTLEKLLKMIISFLPVKNKPNENEIIDKLITTTCSLALPVIDKERVIK